MRRRLLVVILLVASGIAACKSSSTASTTAPSTGGPTVVTLTAAGNVTLGVGDTRQLKAVALLSDGTTEILTNSAAWSSSNAAVLTVDNAGIVTGVSAGTASVLVGVGTMTGTVSVTVAASATGTQSFIGTVTDANGLSGTLEVTVLSTSRAAGTLAVGPNSVSLIGRFDAGANVLNVSGGAYTILGTLSNGVVTGTITDAANNVGGFSAIDSTHIAVTTFCGTYTADDGSGGAWNMSLSTSGAATADSTRSDAAAPPLVFVGRGDAGNLSLATGTGNTATGTVQGGAAAGSFQASATAKGTFSASASACR